MPIRATRALLSAALDGSLNNVEFRIDENFGFEVPMVLEGFEPPAALANVNTELLNPRGTWADTDAYDAAASKLVNMFHENFAQYADFVGEDVMAQAVKPK